MLFLVMVKIKISSKSEEDMFLGFSDTTEEGEY